MISCFKQHRLRNLSNSIKRNKLVYDQMIQVDEQANLLQRSTEFFAVSRFRGLAHQLKTFEVEAKDISEVSIKCYGYGYFQVYKDAIKTNLLTFMKDCLDTLPNLISFKLILNGFDIGNKYLQKITSLLKESLNRPNSPMLAVWLHTNHLTSCLKTDFIDILDLISIAGMNIHRQDISVQITHWQFEANISLPDLEDDFRSFIANSISGLNFKKFRLELSSWYLQLDEAFTFVRSGMRHQQIIEKMGIEGEDAQKLTKEYLIETQAQSYAEFSNGKNVLEKRIKSIIGRSLHEEVIFHLVKNFQDKLIELVHNLLGILPHVEDFTIDFRNWNGLLKMHELRSVLQTKSGPKKQFSMLQRKSQLGQTQGDSNDPVLRTTYLV